MRLAVVNFKSKKNIDDNMNLMQHYISKAVNENVDFIVFPELCLTGYQYYLDGIRTLNKDKLDSFISQLLEISSKNNIYICFGSPYFKEDETYNSAIIICTDKTVKI